MNIKRDILLRVWIVFVVFAVIGILISIRVFKIQVKEGKYWRSISDSLTLRCDIIEPIRGNILTSDEKLLVTSVPIYDVHLDLQSPAWTDDEIYRQNIDSLCFDLTILFNDKSEKDYKTYKEYKKIISTERNNKNRYFLFKHGITHNQLKAMKTFPILKLNKFRSGLIVEEKSVRIHPFKPLAERLIGYKVEGIRGVGFEGSFENYLAGKSGKRYMQRISGGNWIPINYENELDPEEGNDLVTTLDINIQDHAENALLKGLITNDADNGCVIVMEVQTGKVLAIANLTKAGKDGYIEEYNYAIGPSTEPGSTFKLASALLLLENNFIGPDDYIDTRNGQWQIFDKTIKDSKEGGYGKISFKEAFEYSSNVAFAKLVTHYFSDHPELFYNGLEKLHLTVPLNISISGEGNPYIKKTRDWVGTTLAYMAHGYELRLTPLQVLTLYNAVANNGRMLKPIFLTEVRHIGNPVEKFGTEEMVPKICSDRTLQIIKSMMVGVVEKGTAMNIRSPLYRIAGKTGTAKTVVNGKYKNIYQASFAGFFPADNPKYSCMVVINNPSKGDVYGARVAAPVFREIADKLYGSGILEQLPPDPVYPVNMISIDMITKGAWEDYINLGKIYNLDFSNSYDGSEWAAIDKNQYSPISREYRKKAVPDVRGMLLTDAVYLLENMGYTVKAEGFGRVRSQVVQPDKAFSKTIIHLILG